MCQDGARAAERPWHRWIYIAVSDVLWLFGRDEEIMIEMERNDVDDGDRCWCVGVYVGASMEGQRDLTPMNFKRLVTRASDSIRCVGEAKGIKRNTASEKRYVVM